MDSQARVVNRLKESQVGLRPIQQGPGRHLQGQFGAARLNRFKDPPDPLNDGVEGSVGKVIWVMPDSAPCKR